MKKILLTVLIGICVLGMSTSAMAITILPGLSTGIGAPITTSAILELNSIPFLGKDTFGTTVFSGNLTQKVYREATGLLFTWQFTTDAGSGFDAINTLTATNFTGFTTNVDATGAAGAWYLRRTNPSTVGFDSQLIGVTPGSTSDLFWIQTNAQSYTWGNTSLIDGGTVDIRTYAPATPEPSSLMLLGMGILGLFGLGKKKL